MSEPLNAASKNVTPELFTLVAVDLFRAGNASGPRLDHVRLDKDIQTVEETIGGKTVVMVLPKTGGISTFDNGTFMKGKVWKIPGGTPLPATILVHKDKYNGLMKGMHYSISPAYKMPLEQYLLGLQQLALAATPMFQTVIKTGNDRLNDEAKVMGK